MKAAIYTRVSTEHQTDGYSLDAQYNDLIEYVARHKMILTEVYTDPGISAKDLNRIGVKQMIDDLKKGCFEALIVHKLDRLTRNLGDLHDLVEMVNKHKVKIISLSEDIDTSTPGGRMFVYFLGIFAQMYRENLAEEVLKGQSQKHRSGERVVLGLIHGYDTEEGKLVVNEAEAHIIRRIFGMYVYKGYGYGRICQELNEEGIKNKNNSLWAPSTVKGILSNKTYIGMNEWGSRNNERTVIQGEHEPIVTEEVFNLAQRQLERRAKLEMSRSSYNYPFSGIIKCGECGASYTSHNSVKRRNDRLAYTNYRCSNRKGGKCKASDIAELKLSGLFFAYLKRLELSLREYVAPPDKVETQDTEKVRRRLEKDISKNEQRISNLGMDLADRIITREDYKIYTTSINETLGTLRKELAELQPAEEKKERPPHEIIGMIERLKKDWEDMNNEDRKFVLQTLVKQILIQKESGEWRILEVVFD